MNSENDFEFEKGGAVKRYKLDTKSDALDKTKDANHKLRAENRQLRKQVKQLKKELNKFGEMDWEEWGDESEPEVEKAQPNCEKCYKPVKLVPAGIFLIHVCESCGWKKRIGK